VRESRRRRRRGDGLRPRGEGIFHSPPGEGSGEAAMHFGGYLMHSDYFILKSWFAVYRMLQGCATDSVSFSPTGCSSWA